MKTMAAAARSHGLVSTSRLFSSMRRSMPLGSVPAARGLRRRCGQQCAQLLYRKPWRAPVQHAMAVGADDGEHQRRGDAAEIGTYIKNNLDNDFSGAPLLFQAPGCPKQLIVGHKSGLLFLYDRDRIRRERVTVRRAG